MERVFIRNPEAINRPAKTEPVLRERATVKPVVNKPEIIVLNKEVTPEKDMTAFGKTIVGKILKGAAIAGGSILGLGAVSGVIKGVGAAAGAGSVISGAKSAIDKVGSAAVGLVTGTTAEERKQVQEIKAEAKEAADKLEQVDRLVKAGATPARARAMAGVSEPELQNYDNKPISTSGIGDFFSSNKNIVLMVAGVIAAFWFLPKIMKKR